jgi:predicted GNAT family acetyltransferase
LQRFELPIANGVIAAAYYRIEAGRVVLIHTEVPFEFPGQGIATSLARGTFDLLRRSGRRPSSNVRSWAGSWLGMRNMPKSSPADAGEVFVPMNKDHSK